MKELQVTEHNQQRVLTTEQLAEAYETDVKNIQMNFSRNQQRFTSGKDYYLLEGKELADFKNWVTNSGLVHKNARSLYLWTERGANRHCKILDTDKAWQQFDLLEEMYFRVKNNEMNLIPSYQIQDPVQRAKTWIKEYEQKVLLENHNTELKSVIEKQKPKVETFDAVMSADGLYSFKQAAAELNYKNMGQNKLYSILKQRNVLMNDNIPYRPYIENGYFKVVETVFYRNGIPKTTYKTYFTMKGIHAVRKKLDQLGYGKTTK